MSETKKLAISKAEFAQLLSISTDSVKRVIGRGEVRAVRLGRRILIPASEVGRILRGASVKGVGGVAEVGLPVSASGAGTVMGACAQVVNLSRESTA